ncbi:MAG TPA: benzoylformate decarboxylase [Burkholderiales bacterium]|nr:benzoylformate decarboxylase [Burkholderiales bacterium]
MQRQASDRSASISAASQTAVREAVFSLLRAFDMTTVFGNPGSTELRMFRDWPHDFRYVLGLQESIAVAMADGYAQARRKPALVNLHSAGGVGHALGSVFTAWRNQTPLVILAGQQTRAMLPTDPFLCARSAVDFPKPYVKWSIEPARAQDVPHALAQAIYTALQKPCGPVFVSVPEDDWDVACEPMLPREVSARTAPEPHAIERLAQALNASQRPALVVGAAVDQDDAWDDVIQLAERLEARVWHSPMAGRRGFPQSHRLFAGFLAPLRQPLADQLAEHDVVLVIGAPVFTYHVHTEGHYIAPGTRLFQLTDDVEQAARAPIGTSIVGSVRLGVEQLLPLVQPHKRARQQALGRPRVPAASDPISGAYAMYAIAQSLPGRAVIVEEAPSHRNAFNEHVVIDTSGGFYACASGGLGFALPAAVGVALADASRKVVAILGDGSSLYTIQGLWSAAELRLPISFVILNNSGYGAVKSLGARLGIDRTPGSDIRGVDFVDVARGFGCRAERVERAMDLPNVLMRAHASKAPTVVEVRMNPTADKLY